MADDLIRVTGGFAQRNARAHIICLRCPHFVVVSQTIMDRMFPKSMPLHWAEKRLVCTRCGQKAARIEAVLPQPR